MGRTLLAFLVGLVLGAFAIWFALDRGSSQAVDEAALAAAAVAARANRAAVPASELAEPATARANAVDAASERAHGDESDLLITQALRRHALLGLKRGWALARKDEMPADDVDEGMASYEKLVLESAEQIGRSLAQRRTKAEAALADARTGGVQALLDKLGEGGVGPLPEIVRDLARLTPLFQRVGEESFRDGLADRQHPDKNTEDAVTLTWPAGVFKLTNLMKEKNPYPRDVTLAGAGIDATMLVLNSNLMTRDSLRNFAIRDCTIHTNNNYLFDLRLKPASVRLDRARFVGFDMGAGASCLFGTQGLALWARNCLFSGAYGRSPMHGTVFDVRTDALLARFENCTFSLVNMEIWRWYAGATVLFLGCKLEEMLDDPLKQAADKPGVVFDGCSVTKHAGGTQNVPQLDLDTLFPNWKARLE